MNLDYSETLKKVPGYLYSMADDLESTASNDFNQKRANKRLKYLAQYLVWAYQAKNAEEVVLKAQILAVILRQAKYGYFKQIN